MLHVDAHLVCYRIAERRVWGWNHDVFRPRTVTVTSAAGKDTAALLWREQLCVPSVVTTD